MKHISFAFSTFYFFSAAIASVISFETSPVLAQTSGCGSGKSWYLTQVMTPASARQFKEACDEHDACYDTYGKSKLECDKDFHKRMLGICARDHNTILGKPRRIACNGRADAFYTAVVEYGQGSYRKAQDAAVSSSTPPTSTSLKSLQSFNFPGHFIRHANFFGYISVMDSNLSRNDATWSMVPGLANSQCSSFESKNFPGHYLRHQGLRIKLHQNDNSGLFKADATFCLRNGLADRSSFSLESLNFPNHYIRHRSSELWVDPQANDELYKQDATFRIVYPFVQ